MSDKPNKIVETMLAKDKFSQWLGIENIDQGEGQSTIRMQVRPEMVNGFGVAHGAITFALADSAFAFACNSPGRKSVSVECSINHIQPVHVGDILTAEAREESSSNKIGTYIVHVKNQRSEVVALFKGTAYRTSKSW